MAFDMFVGVAYALYFLVIGVAAGYELPWLIVAVGVTHFVLGAVSSLLHPGGALAAAEDRYLQPSRAWSAVALLADVVLIPLSIIFGSVCTDAAGACTWELWAATGTALAGNTACLAERVHKIQMHRKRAAAVAPRFIM